MTNNIEILQVGWQENEAELRSIRTTVFIEEQQVPVELEWDEDDLDCVHLLVKKGADYIATARLLNSGQIGRMAVLKPYRKSGIGSMLLTKLLSIAKSMKMNDVFLNAQINALSFYKQHGFNETGDIFDDAGIPHIRMEKEVKG